MPLNASKGNMYHWITHTLNFIKGKCPHDCAYCFMKRFPQRELRFDGSELSTDLGEGNTIFVGSSCDMWAKEIPYGWLCLMLELCLENNNNRYLFQSKNPARFSVFDFSVFPGNVLLGTTIESNRHYPEFSKAPPPVERMEAMTKLEGVRKMVSIEPVMDFDTDTMLSWMESIKPDFVSIGADSRGHRLPEPLAGKIEHLIERLLLITTVRLKRNLNRLWR